MARYDYKCTSCGTVFEVQHGMTERPEVHCPSCGADAEKVFTPQGFGFLQHRPARRLQLHRRNLGLQQLRGRLRQLSAQGQLTPRPTLFCAHVEALPDLFEDGERFFGTSDMRAGGT